MASFISNSVEETIEFARHWSRSLKPNDVIALAGELGTGKTHFVKGLLEGLGGSDEVTSPTFTLIHEYRSGWLQFFTSIFTESTSRVNSVRLVSMTIWRKTESRSWSGGIASRKCSRNEPGGSASALRAR